MLKNSIYALFLVFAFSCSDDENPADSFLGAQDVTITLNGTSYEMKGGDYYDGNGASNCEISNIYLDSSDLRFRITNGVTFDRFGFTFSNSFNLNGLAIGEVVENPDFFSFTYKKDDQSPSYIGAQIYGEDTFVNGDIGDAQRAEVTNSSLIINDRVSNGIEQVIDGVRQEYPLERIGGVLNIEFNDEAGESQVLDVNFNLEGENIVIEQDEYITTQTDDDGGSGNGNGGGGNGGDCGNLNYNGPTEGQIAQWCEAAQLYECLGQTEGLNYVCDAISEYGGSCPYCN